MVALDGWGGGGLGVWGWCVLNNVLNHHRTSAGVVRSRVVPPGFRLTRAPAVPPGPVKARAACLCLALSCRALSLLLA